MSRRRRFGALLLAFVMIITIIPAQNAYAANTKINKCKITLSKTAYYNTGSACKPKITVKYGKNYTVTYRNNVNAGTASLIVKGKGNYSGTLNAPFTIQKKSEKPVEPDDPVVPDKKYYTITKPGKSYRAVTSEATNSLASGQSSDIRILSYSLGQCDANALNYNNQIATVSHDGYNYYFVADTWNNRVLIYRTTGTTPWDNTVTPYLVLGQTDFTSSRPLSKATMNKNLAKLNWPVGVAACVSDNKIKIYVTDTNNDRILVWNDIPGSNGAPADFAMYNVVDPDSTQYVGEDSSKGYINRNSTEIGWPWSIWTNGNRLICTDTRSSRILIWDGLPASAADYPDTVVFTGQGSTPRTIISDGDYLIVGDHNINHNNQIQQGYHVYNSITGLLNSGKKYQYNNGDLVCTKDGANIGGTILTNDLSTNDGKTVLKKGSLLIMQAGSMKVYLSNDGNTRKIKSDGEQPDYYLGGGTPDEPMGYYFTSVDCQQIIVDSNNNLYSTHFNKSMIVGYMDGTFPAKPVSPTQEQIDNRRDGDIFTLPGVPDTMYRYRPWDGITEIHSTKRPNLSVGASISNIDISASNARYHYQNCVPDIKNGHMVVSCDHPLGSNLMIYKNVPDQEGAVPDIIFSFNLEVNVAFTKLFTNGNKTGILAGGKKSLFVWDDINDALAGKGPSGLMINSIGSVSTESEDILGFEYIDGKLLVAVGEKVHIFDGLPTDGQAPVKTIVFQDNGSMDIRGAKTKEGKIYVSFTGRERGFRIVELSEILNMASDEYSCNVLSGLVNRLIFDRTENGGKKEDSQPRDFEATATYITEDGHVICNVGFCQIWIWNSVTTALQGTTYDKRLGIGTDYYNLKDLNPTLVKEDYVKIQAPTTLFMATNLAFDERGYLWVADYKFAGGIRRFKGKL